MTKRTRRTRDIPPPTDQHRILADQGDCCLYCGLPLDSYVVRRGRLIPLVVNFDHVIPWSWRVSRDCVAACHVCNGIKADKLFETIEDAQSYVLAAWVVKGYRLAHPKDFVTSCPECRRIEPCRCPDRFALPAEGA